LVFGQTRHDAAAGCCPSAVAVVALFSSFFGARRSPFVLRMLREILLCGMVDVAF
jgi:hypothetical protein